MRRTFANGLAAIALCCVLAACSAKSPPLISEAVMRIAVVPFSQPRGTQDLMAGYISDMTPPIEQKTLSMLDRDFELMLGELSKRNFLWPEEARLCMSRQPKNANTAAFEYWLGVGRCLKADLLIVPQIHLLQERVGGEMGATRPAAVSMDIFLLDVNNRALLFRSRYDEKQRALLDNLLDVGKFIDRKGRWVDAETLAREGMFKAIKEFGL